MSIAKACVIGSGVMGSGIAAQIANAGRVVEIDEDVGCNDEVVLRREDLRREVV